MTDLKHKLSEIKTIQSKLFFSAVNQGIEE